MHTYSIVFSFCKAVPNSVDKYIYHSQGVRLSLCIRGKKHPGMFEDVAVKPILRLFVYFMRDQIMSIFPQNREKTRPTFVKNRWVRHCLCMTGPYQLFSKELVRNGWPC